jgi:hypothetical protein
MRSASASASGFASLGGSRRPAVRESLGGGALWADF